MKTQEKISFQNTSILSRIAFLVASLLVAGAIFLPLWRIELMAPQYPEGLMLQLHAEKIGGDVEIINGLNHYIGMKTLHTKDFIEFAYLPYIIGFYAFLMLLAGAIGRKKWLYGVFIAFVVFGVVAMIDFYRWNYNYGHDLDTNAAIKVPGMSYQPPLIGYKQLLNFGAYSIPDTGGWLFLGAGFLMLLAVLCEARIWCFFLPTKRMKVALGLFLSMLWACGGVTEPQAIKLNVDDCAHCKMKLADARFATQLITKKGRIYKFDDLSCLVPYQKEQASAGILEMYVADYEKPASFLPVDKAFYVKSEEVNSPMGGNIASFSTKEMAETYVTKWKGELVSWEQVQASFSKHVH